MFFFFSLVGMGKHFVILSRPQTNQNVLCLFAGQPGRLLTTLTASAPRSHHIPKWVKALPVYLSIGLSIYVSLCLPVFMSIRTPISFYPSLYLYVFPLPLPDIFFFPGPLYVLSLPQSIWSSLPPLFLSLSPLFPLFSFSLSFLSVPLEENTGSAGINLLP